MGGAPVEATADERVTGPGQAEGESDGRPESRPERLRAGLRLAARPVAIYLASRFVVLISAWTASRIIPHLTPGNAPFGPGGLITAWDGIWYLNVATSGYPGSLPLAPDGSAAQSTIAFFPLYPIGIRAAQALGFPPRIAALLVAGAAGLVAVVLLWFLLRRLWGPEAADRGVALFCFFPGALVLSLAYAEALMLALAIGCLLALLSRWWVTAGVLAALATATRPNALALVAACAWAAGAGIRSRREWRALVAPVLAPVGFVAFQVFLWARTGEADAWYRTQREGWNERLALDATWEKLTEWFRQPLADVNITLTVVGAVILAVTLVLLVRTRPPGPVLVYTLGIVALALVSATLGARPRFVLTAFPLVAVPGRYLRGIAFGTLLACSATALGAFTVVSLTTLLATP